MRFVSNVAGWIDERLPIIGHVAHHLREYRAPKNLNFWYYFGSFALVLFLNQYISGLWLTMFYKPMATEAFHSVESLMRDVSYGWLIRYLHSTGASFFFIVVYLHIFRGLLYGSYKKPRELLWLLGCFLFVLMIIEAFFGYLLPWGQMSYWGAQVITSLFEAVPYVGPQLALFIRGDYTISDVVLNRFFALHVVAIPVVFLCLIGLHLLALHSVGSNNPDGKEYERTKPTSYTVSFHPYFTIKDLFGTSVLATIFLTVVFYFPEGAGLFLEAPNFIEANPMITPEHIAPVWYMTPFYAILRAVPNKLAGVLAMGSSLGVLFLVPWLDRSPIRSIRYRSWMHKMNLSIFVISFLSLGLLGIQQPTPWKTFLARVFSAGYFCFFLFLPMYSSFEKPDQEDPST